MYPSKRTSFKAAISRAATIVIAVIIILIIIGSGAYFLFGRNTATTNTGPTTTGTRPTTSTSTTGTGGIPSSFTYETASTPEWLDPQVSYFSYDYTILQNVYEPLLFYEGTNSTAVIPWLAANYTMSPDGKTATFNLRQGITFADGEPLNSSAVYFSLNKLLIDDSTSPTSHDSQASWIVQQLLNTSLSSVLSGTYVKKGASYAQAVLAENFVQITGPYSFTIHIQNPNSAFPYLIAGDWASIVAPNYVMQHDLAIWNASSSGYSLTYPNLSGNTTQRIIQYLTDFSETCDVAGSATTKGCGYTYLDGSASGSLAGTGPYTITSVSSSNDITLQARSGYWGGAYQFMTSPPSGFGKITPKIATINIKYVPDATTRTLDMKSAASSGQAMAIDLTADHLYDFANRTAWLSNGKLQSIVTGTTIFGPTTSFSTLFDPFGMNVTNQATGTLYKFQPFADRRIRLAFADAVNLTEVNIDVNNRLGLVAQNMEPPGLPPNGVYNASIAPVYSYNPDQVATLLIQAMQSPVRSFTFVNGSAASSYFNNSFGCTSFGAGGKCSNPIPQTITLYYATGDTVDEAIFNDIAATVNNVSTTYNMGLTVSLTPVPTGQFVSLSLSGYFYMYALGWFADYPWVVDFDLAAFAPGGSYSAPDGWNITQMGTLFNQETSASSSGNIAGIISASHSMNQLSNQMVQYLWTFWSYNIMVITSNVQGYYYNAALSSSAGGIAGPQYFATYT